MFRKCEESITLPRSDSARFTRVKFMPANRNRLSRWQTTLSYGPQKDLYWLTLNVLIILAIILAWSISWGQLDNSAIRLLMFERVMPAYARWIDRRPRMQARCNGIICSLQIFVDPSPSLFLSWQIATSRCENLKPRGWHWLRSTSVR